MNYRNEYREWLDSIAIGDGSYFPDESRYFNYSKLLDTLDSIEYIYSFAMDENRQDDGIYYRYRFMQERGYNVPREVREKAIEELERPCTVYEVMHGMAYRINQDMSSGIAKRTGRAKYFWEMIRSLGLDIYTDDSYDEGAVIRIVDKALRHNYEPDGQGGFFRIHPELQRTPCDMRLIDLWGQINAYEMEYIDEI